jgi:acetyl-CoA carboxylase biotin carboxyl carrier protein
MPGTGKDRKILNRRVSKQQSASQDNGPVVDKGSTPDSPQPESNETGQAMIDLEFIRGLIEAVDRSGIDTLEISLSGTRIRMSKTPAAARAVVTASSPVAGAVSPPVNTSNPVPAGAAAAVAVVSEVAAAGPDKKLLDVKSPMVGTFYRAPGPDAPPYVEVGDTARKGQTLCILEAMKLMNELESEVSGVIREILVENAEPVEYGQILFRIEPM